MEPKTTIEKLRILLPYWIEHNRLHGAEFGQWAESARTEGSKTLAALLDKAAENTTATAELLMKAKAEVGGSGSGRVPPHPHHHHDHP